ncbi:developmental regulator FlbA [Aspergillus luchuensis]|uniref:Developmental regulator FlbA n=1 Tax=Aspergillus kawachii TaxID=1069201 RepID=A0A146F906_ASPKA|nr:developmental regulator FlbA [Aspergillus luchuensis]
MWRREAVAQGNAGVVEIKNTSNPERMHQLAKRILREAKKK